MPDEPKVTPEGGVNEGPPVDESIESPELPQLDHSLNQMSSKLGELEVERVEASDELERIRNQSAHQIQSQTEDLGGEPSEASAFNDDGGGFMELLREANLSPRHLKFCCGGIVVVFLLVGLVFGGIKFVHWWQDRPNSAPGQEGPPVEEPASEPEEEPDDGVPYQEVGEHEATIIAAILIGEDRVEEDPAVEAGDLLGEELVSDDGLTDSIRLFAEMFESLQVDVPEYLNQSRDRRESLTDYVNSLKHLKYSGEQELEQLQVIRDNLASQYLEVEAEKDLYEQRFFEHLSNLDAYAATAALNDFIVRGEEVVNLRAQSLARQKLIEYYELVLAGMERRIVDIELNEEALVKGIQVVEIEGSDIDLIIQEDEL